ncbi:GNAT family N-acetyltransferase [Pseudofrankia sp. DC12]|uniref:GNAT family N-acetyltransferase n=1 Tax=Pseudofrankia sp. DC12 TaxID=683315 RepID=UPI000698F50A|nr:GNAT family N-acetyltransferase [Pseudofrankia sp. DC12]
MSGEPPTDPLVGPCRFADQSVDPAVARISGYTDPIALTRELEELAFRGWSALRTERVDGWVLRDSAGATRRGNSVWPHDDVADLPAALAQVDRFYAHVGRPAFVQLTPASRPGELRQALDAAGYEPEQGPTDVCVAGLAGIAAAAAGLAERSAPPGGRGRGPVRVALAESPGDSWLDVCAAGGMSMFGAHRAASVAVLRRTETPAIYVTATLDGVPVGAGRGVLDGQWLGIYSMATLPAARGQGAATTVVAALSSWATSVGARRALLQVEEQSIAARRIYAALGFLPVYRYAYRRRLAGATTTGRLMGAS